MFENSKANQTELIVAYGCIALAVYAAYLIGKARGKAEIANKMPKCIKIKQFINESKKEL